MGISDSFGSAFGKAQLAADNVLPIEGRDLHHRERLRQADGDADRAALPRDGIQAVRHGRDGEASARTRHSRRDRAQDSRGPSERHRHDAERRGAAPDQHAARQGIAARRLHDAPGGDREPRRLYDHPCPPPTPRATQSCRCAPARRRCSRCRSGTREFQRKPASRWQSPSFTNPPTSTTARR